MKWEYISFVFHYSPDEKNHKDLPWVVLSENEHPRINTMEKYLNIVGEDGWEITSLIVERFDIHKTYAEPLIYRAFCKRPK